MVLEIIEHVFYTSSVDLYSGKILIETEKWNHIIMKKS